MAYELFCIDGPAPLGKFPDRCRVVTADSLGAAITAACKLIADGATVWKLKGSEGFRTALTGPTVRAPEPLDHFG